MGPMQELSIRESEQGRLSRAILSCRRSMVAAAERAAVAGVPGEILDRMLKEAREAFRAKTIAMSRD
jgi:hypothetical protein